VSTRKTEAATRRRKSGLHLLAALMAACMRKEQMMHDGLVRIDRDLKESEMEGPVHERAGQPRGQRPQIETHVSIRAASSGDGESLRRMFSRVSSETIYRRFHIPYPDVPERMLALMLDVDHHDEESLVAVEEGEIVGHAMYVRLGDGSEAEMAIVVEDGFQSKGVGKLLLRKLAEKARSRGIVTFAGTVLIENRRMLGLISAVFTESTHVITDGVFDFRVLLRTLKPADSLRILRHAA
jgi:GNAT superfamily N-acetyltransferase